MKYSFKMLTQVFQEQNCLLQHTDLFSKYGTKAMIITGKYSAKACGALQDVIEILEQKHMEYIVFDEIENNPSLETVQIASKKAREFSAEVIIGIGGGSPLDASKAIAVLAINDIKGVDLFKNEFTKALPIIAIPTTAGTGSEVTPYSVLLRRDLQTKVSFGNDLTFPKYALLDVKYTQSLSETSTINTAIDAFTHSLEGYLCNRATVMSDALAIDAISMFGSCFGNLISKNVTKETREKLLYVSLIGGIVIANTGVTIAHGMGYCYTYFKDIPHGKANGLLMKTYLNYIYDEKREKIDTVMKLLGCSDLNDFADKMELLIGKPPVLTKEEVLEYTELTIMQKGSISNTARLLDKERIQYLWEMMKQEA